MKNISIIIWIKELNDGIKNVVVAELVGDKKGCYGINQLSWLLNISWPEEGGGVEDQLIKHMYILTREVKCLVDFGI